MGAAIGTIPSLSTYQPGSLAIGSTVYIEIVDSNNATTAQSWNMTMQDFVGKAPSAMNGSPPVTTDLIAFYQKATGLPMQCQVGDLGIPAGNLPAGGGTGTLLIKSSATSFSAGWTSIASVVGTAQGIVNFGTATAVQIGIATAGIVSSMIANLGVGSSQIANAAVGSAQLASGFIGTSQIVANSIGSSQMQNNAIGTGQIASSLGIATSLSIGGLLTVGGTATITGTTILNGGLQVSGTSLMTGILSVSGTTTFTGTHGVIGTSIFTGSFILGSQATGVLVSSGTGLVTSQGGMVLLNTLSPNNVASTNDTTSFSLGYRTYMFLFDNIGPVSQTTTFQMQIATSGSNFLSGISYVSIAQVNVNSTLVTDTSTSSFLLTGTRATTQMATTVTLGLAGFVKFFNPASSTASKSVVGSVSYFTPGGAVTSTLAQAGINGMWVGNQNPITGVNFLFNTGNIQTGTIKIYGIT